ncbi:hypothetical protein [Mycoplasmopsis alligatoris]|uniref:Uncharacterized protein n=1 Tax=Mycoplasmopsis alligatoris A21JP2 TaxID=747682 RepID=D4XWE4_9BACT|nr:hypothetical protein [Mycoplasmopsis alligatoris]EFF41345.1 hypothetical protein MALL_0486 [Mycoplasmopsis alligatoris A21JP2]
MNHLRVRNRAIFILILSIVLTIWNNVANIFQINYKEEFSNLIFQIVTGLILLILGIILIVFFIQFVVYCFRVKQPILAILILISLIGPLVVPVVTLGVKIDAVKYTIGVIFPLLWIVSLIWLIVISSNNSKKAL